MYLAKKTTTEVSLSITIFDDFRDFGEILVFWIPRFFQMNISRWDWRSVSWDETLWRGITCNRSHYRALFIAFLIFLPWRVSIQCDTFEISSTSQRTGGYPLIARCWLVERVALRTVTYLCVQSARGVSVLYFDWLAQTRNSVRICAN